MAQQLEEDPATKNDTPEFVSTGNAKAQQAMEVAEEARQKDYANPSFGGQLFMGRFSPTLMHPFPKQSEEDKRIGDVFIVKLMDFLKANLDPEEVERTHEIPKYVIKGMAELGVFAMKVPKEYDGLGFSQVNYNRVVMQVSSYCASTAVLISAHQSIGVPQPLKMFGTEKQKRQFFPRFRQGSISAFALTEPNVGSDPAEMSAEAVLSDDGSHYILNGEKLWCTNGTIADIIVVMAKTAPKIVRGKERKQISAFILEMNTPGIEVIHRCEFMGLKGIYNGAIRFTNVKIPRENLLDAEGRGLALALATINVGRLTLPAACTGACKLCLSIARQWSSSRIQWGKPIGLHEAGSEKIAYIAATTFAMEAVTWLTATWSDEGKVDIRIEAAMAKLFCTEALWKIVDMTMQLRGGRGYETSASLKARGEPALPVERIMRDCRINMILEGSSEIMKLFLAREAMDPHLKQAGALLNPRSSIGARLSAASKAFGHYSLWYPKQWFDEMSVSNYREMGDLEEHYQFIERTSHRLARKLFSSMARYQQRLESKQMLLSRLIDVGVDLFVMSAVCSYAIARIKEAPFDKSPIALADYFCREARQRIAARFDSLGKNNDKLANELAKQVLDNKMTWLEQGIVQV